MIRNLSRRSVVAGATLLLLAACQGDTTSPSESTDGGGTRSTGQTPSPADTARTPTPAPSPASAIELSVYVGLASPGPDTLRSTPVANARVAVLSQTFTRGTGPDTLTVTETAVASSTTDALGKVSFANLPAVGYRIEAVADGRSGPPTSIRIAPPYSSRVATSIIIRPAP